MLCCCAAWRKVAFRTLPATGRKPCQPILEALTVSSAIPTIQVAATAGILEYTAAGGGDVAWVVREAKLTLEDLSRPEQRLPLRKFVTLIEAASRATGDDCFGAHLGQICGLRELGLPGYLANFA